MKTVWNKFKCDHGARWTATETSFDGETTGECQFSGCQPGHKFKLIGPTSDRDEACRWFKRPTFHQAFNVYLKSKLIDTVFYVGDVDKQEVKTSLIDHDDYDPNIRVTRARN